MKRIGLFGGSFDPPHRAHVALAHAALDALALDAVWWIPAGDPWQKSRTITPAVHRAAMVEAAIAEEPRFRLERCELQRPGPSYTLDTVNALQALHPQTRWVLIIGQDQYAGLHTWRGWQALLAMVELAVANRPGAALAVDAAVARTPHRAVPLPMLDVSSTDIRRRAAAGEPLDDLVPPAVRRYIDHHLLYRKDAAAH